jgi:hypothetical protein
MKRVRSMRHSRGRHAGPRQEPLVRNGIANRSAPPFAIQDPKSGYRGDAQTTASLTRKRHRRARGSTVRRRQERQASGDVRGRAGQRDGPTVRVVLEQGVSPRPSAATLGHARGARSTFRKGYAVPSRDGGRRGPVVRRLDARRVQLCLERACGGGTRDLAATSGTRGQTLRGASG